MVRATQMRPNRSEGLTPMTQFLDASGAFAFKKFLPFLFDWPGMKKPMQDTSDNGSNALIVDTLGRLGSLEVRLARTKQEIKRAQNLRYDVFFKERETIAGLGNRLFKRDADSFDEFCDHLLVLDHETGDKPKIVGTYRLLRQEQALKAGGFYSAHEYHIQPLIEAFPTLQFLELGRSCVLPAYRNKRTVELLWQGIWAYVRRHRIDVMFGCASFEGTDPELYAMPLSFLHHFAGVEAPWHVEAVPERLVAMNRIDKALIDPKSALRSLPPLIKGYLRLGARFGEGAVIDTAFNTIDVLVVLPVSHIDARYIGYFGAGEEKG
jgi:L-ornithine Nalpha-acyltransferase